MAKEWCVMAPISFFPISTDDRDRITTPFSFNDKTEIISIPEWFKNDPKVKSMESYPLSIFPITVKYDFIAKDIFIAPDQSRPMPIKQAIDTLQYLCYSVWLSTPCVFSCNMIFFAQKIDESWKIDHIYNMPPIFDIFQNPKGVSDFHLQIAKQFFLTILNFKEEPAVKLAIDFGLKALTELTWEVRFLLLWIALESLFGTALETTFQVSQRIACFINTDGTNLKNIFDDIKDSYAKRSMLAHGSGNVKKLTYQKSMDYMHQVQIWFRASMTKILQDPKLIEKFNQKKDKRDVFFNEIVFHTLSTITPTHL